MAFQSGEFKIPNSVSARTKAAAIFNNNLYIVNPCQGYNNQVTFDLSKLKKHSSSPVGDEPIDPDALTKSSNWILQSLPLPSSLAKPALVAFAGAMYCFINSNGRVIASEFSTSEDSSAPGTWSQPITLLESDGKTVPAGPTGYIDADVSATTVGDNIIILAFACTSSASHPAQGTFVAVYDTRDIDTSTNKWTAKWHDYLPLGGINAALPVQVSVEWFTAIAPNGKNTDPPTFYVAVMVQPFSTILTPAPLRFDMAGQVSG